MSYEAIIAAVSAPDDGPRFFDEAQYMTPEQILRLTSLIDAASDYPSFVHVNPRHRWLARWTTRTGKALARKLWGAA